MTSNQCIYLTLVFLLMGIASSSFISNDILESHGFSSRSLLQAKKSCTENMENKNYTIITSKCKGPQYAAKSCCEALKEFACPFADAINDPQTDCAATMFSYINLYGRYPPGLFANECKEGKEGLDCTAVLDKLEAAKKKSGAEMVVASPSSMLVLLCTLLVFVIFCLS